MIKKKIIAVVGPTASGKTALAVEIAKRFDGEVISFDSMQIYKGMDIASAKPTAEEMQGIVHHLISVKDNAERYSVAAFVEDAKRICDEVISRNKLPVFCGGTGLYIDSLVNNIEFTKEEYDEKLRSSLYERLNAEGELSLYNELKSIDGEYADSIDANNSKRIIRALELYYSTGIKMSEQIKNSRNNESEYDSLYIGINYSDRSILYGRINNRVDEMLKKGLLDEAREFLNRNDTKTANQAIGIKELRPYFDGEISLEDAVESIKRETRHYAKRQLTWFKRNKAVNWILADKTDNVFNEAFAYTEEFLKGAD